MMIVCPWENGSHLRKYTVWQVLWECTVRYRLHTEAVEEGVWLHVAAVLTTQGLAGVLPATRPLVLCLPWGSRVTLADYLRWLLVSRWHGGCWCLLEHTDLTAMRNHTGFGSDSVHIILYKYCNTKPRPDRNELNGFSPRASVILQTQHSFLTKMYV
jgi:hypothetical protein